MKVVDEHATIDAGLVVHWAGVEALVIDSGAGDDRLSVAGRPLATGQTTMVGGPGDDTYAIATRGSRLQVIDAGGVDTLDFSQSASGVRIRLAGGQGLGQRIDRLGNRLLLNGTIENVVGSASRDMILGNGADNLLRGGGNDFLLGRGGSDILIGGTGHDVLIGGAGRGVLIGGLNRDALIGTVGDDILIAGATRLDQDDRALRAILAEWSSGRDYETRLRNLTRWRSPRRCASAFPIHRLGPADRSSGRHRDLGLQAHDAPARFKGCTTGPGFSNRPVRPRC